MFRLERETSSALASSDRSLCADADCQRDPDLRLRLEFGVLVTLALLGLALPILSWLFGS